ncbi:MAG: hypothetical protein KJ070_02695 [Verrucomicrobia bacterium]|nr:hypothetical protein [Verrucomicrobiota bacterium]
MTFHVTVGGQFLDGVTNAYVSGEGVQATVIDFNKPMPQGQFNQLRDKLRELQDRKQAALRDRRRGEAQTSTNTWSADDESMIEELRARILKNPPNRHATPAIVETVTVKVAIATNAALGEREIRLGTPNGLSNPLAFRVGQLPEFSAPAAKPPNPDVDRFRERTGRAPTNAPAKPELRVTLPATVNGQIMPGEVDRIHFKARKGQKLVVAASARALIPYLADAVPGWFQATLVLYDAKGKELAYNDDFRFHPDPVLFCEIPKDGEYTIEIKDAIYRGREDFVYRLTIGELPYLTSIFPLGGRVGEKVSVELKGWNLTANELTLDLAGPASGILPVSTRTEKWVSNTLPFAVNDLPECRETELNNEAAHAQAVTAPVIVNGRVDPPGDTDVFRFPGRAGDEIVAEIHARRLGSPLDSVLKLTDAAGNQLAFNDDSEDKGSGLNTHHADAYLRAKLPANGSYYLYLGDTTHQGGPEYAYRLRVGPPQPNFELRIVPSSINARGGATIPITVYALRKDGFTDDIALALKDAPGGFKLSGARIPANQDKVRLTATLPTDLRQEAVSLDLEGRASVQGREIVRPVVPADDVMQAFFYRHLVPAKELKVAVSGRWTQRASVRIVGETPVKIPAGGSVRVQLDAPARAFNDRLQLELSEPPEGISIKNISATPNGTEIVFAGDAKKVKPGLQGNLIVNAFAPRTEAAGKAKGPANQRRSALGTLPAIPFEVVAGD